jgi:hypothetical protein
MIQDMRSEVFSPALRETHRAKCAKGESKAGTWLLWQKDSSPKWVLDRWGKESEEVARKGPTQQEYSRVLRSVH